MNILAGEARGRRIAAPPGQTTRPILQLLKKRLFDILGPTVAGRRVWDCFAGSGSLGLEALSRGAASCLFVEKDRGAFATLRANVDALGFTGRARLVQGDAFTLAMASVAPAPGLVFLDPPFPTVERTPALIASLIDERIAPALTPDGIVVLRVPAAFQWLLPPNLPLRDRRDHGESALLFYGASTGVRA
jgi:16S rRNA (guanine966-N2)-methyltransferase